jgi:hypothetical protein
MFPDESQTKEAGESARMLKIISFFDVCLTSDTYKITNASFILN